MKSLSTAPERVNADIACYQNRSRVKTTPFVAPTFPAGFQVAASDSARKTRAVIIIIILDVAEGDARSF